MATDPKFIAAKEAYQHALALRLQIDRGDLGALKKNISAFFESSPIFEQFAPTDSWLDHQSSEKYDSALVRAETAIKKINDVKVTELSNAVNDLLQKAQSLATATKSKIESKRAAITFLQKHLTGETQSFWQRLEDGVRSAVGRADHTPSQTLIERLRALPPGLQSEALVHINNLEPFKTKSELKQNITALFASGPYVDCFGSDGNSGLRSYLRTEHTPLLDLRDALKESAAGLATIDNPEKRQVLLSKITEWRESLKYRKELKLSLINYEEKARQLTEAFSGNSKEIVRFSDNLNSRIKKLDERIKSAKSKLAAGEERIKEKQGHIDNYLKGYDDTLKDFDDDRLTSSSGEQPLEAFPSQPPHVERLREEIEGIRSEQAVLFDEIEKAELAISEMMQIIGFCTDKRQEIKDYNIKLDECHEKYKKAKVLVLYFKVGDDISGLLEKLANQLRGGGSSLHTIGSINVVLLFDAGVRAGYDLGLAAIYAKAGMTLALSGTLSILESREVMFSHRLALYLCLEAKAQLGTPDVVTDNLEAISIPPPPELIKASVQASCNLIDRFACHVYESENHWAAQWSHEITRRIVFLNSYNPGILVTKEWLDGEIRDIEKATADNPSLTAESQARIKKAIDADRANIELLNKPFKCLHFKPDGRIKWSGGIEVVGYSLADKATSPKSSFFFQLQTNQEQERRVEQIKLGHLTESVSLYKGDDVEGQAVYHKYVPQGGSPSTGQHYLEIMQRTTSTMTTDAVSAAWVSGMRESPQDSQALHQLSQRLNFAPLAAYPAQAKKVSLPDEVLGDGVSIPSGKDNFSNEIALRLGLIESGGDPNKLLEKMLALPDQVADAGEKLEKLNESIGSGFLQMLVDQASAFSDAGKPIAEPFKLATSSSAYTRYIGQTRFIIDKTGKLAREGDKVWTPQVFRGYSMNMIKFGTEFPDIPIIPGLSVYSGMSIQCLREASQYEILGTNTFSYLKMTYGKMNGYGASQSGAFGGGSKAIDSYIDLHWPEIVDLLRNVTIVGSGAFSELAEDYTNVSASVRTSPQSNAARKLGDTCFRHFCPDLENPFQDLGEKNALRTRRLEWVAGVMSAQAALNASLREALTPESLQAMADGLKEYPADWKKLLGEYSQTEKIRNERNAKFRKKFNDSVTNKLPEEDKAQEEQSSCVRLVQEGMDDLKNKLSGELEALGLAVNEATHRGAQCAYGRSLKGLYEYSLRGQPQLRHFSGRIHSAAPTYLMSIAQSYCEAFNPWASADWRERRVQPTAPVFRAPVRSGSMLKMDEGKIWSVWKQDANLYWNQFAASLFTEQAVFGPTGELFFNSKVPTANSWQSERGLVARGFFQFTSDETKALKLALQDFHNYHVRNPRLNREDPASTYQAIIDYLQKRIVLIDKLLAAIETWKTGKNEDDSKRMPNVVMLVEMPALTEKMMLLAASAHAELCWQVRGQLLALKDLDLISAYSTPAYIEPSVEVDIKKDLVAYLKSSDDHFEYDPLLHGIKRLTLPSDAYETNDVSEKP